MLGDQILAGRLGRFEARAAGDAARARRVKKIRAARHAASEAAARKHGHQLFQPAAIFLAALAAGIVASSSAAAAAFWMAMNWPESLLSLMSANARTIRSCPQTQPNRQPIM